MTTVLVIPNLLNPSFRKSEHGNSWSTSCGNRIMQLAGRLGQRSTKDWINFDLSHVQTNRGDISQVEAQQSLR